MGKIGFICPDGTHYLGSECLKECRMGRRCCPKGYLEFASQDRPSIVDGKIRNPSVTELLRGTRQAYLQRTKDYCVKPSDEAFAITGTKAHQAVEDGGGTLEYEGITGIPDEVDGDTIIDYKVSGSYQIAKTLGIKMVKKELTKVEIDIFDWQMQLNMYRIILGETAKHLKVFAIVRDGNTFIAKNRGILNKTYYIDIPILPKEEVLEYFIAKRNLLVGHLIAGTMPEMCNDKETWNGMRCREYCPVSLFCTNNPHVTAAFGEDNND
jgi:hypothetical protein